MPFWVCDFEQCHKPAVRTIGDCVLCDRHLCSSHLQPEYHLCPQWEDADKYDVAAREAEDRELQVLMGRLNISALKARASYLRQRMPCSIPPPQCDRATRRSVIGGKDYHIEVRFIDGVVWIARIRRCNVKSPPPAVRDLIIQSEVATLKFLEQTKVPAPKVYDFAFEGPENPVGVGFILMEKLPGKCLRWQAATQHQKKKVMEQVADIFVELHKHPFDQLGSLYCPDKNNDKYRVGVFAQESFTSIAGSEMLTIGPFSSFQQFRNTELQLILDQIIQEELYSTQPVDAYLLHKFLIELLPHVVPAESSTAVNKPVFYLKHPYYYKGDHIMVDDDYNITGIIDWDGAHTTSPIQAFSSPVAFLQEDFYQGNNHLGDDEIMFARLVEKKGGAQLAKFVWISRIQHRFNFICGHDLEDWDGFRGLFHGFCVAVKVYEDIKWHEWRKLALKRYKNDPNLQLVLDRFRSR